MLVALKLSRAGYYGGNLDNVLNARVDHVLSALEYEIFNNEYERAYTELNKRN